MKQKFTTFTACILFTLLFTLLSANAQVGINTITPDTGVVLDIWHSSKGILIPRLSYPVRISRKNAAPDGSLVYDNVKKEFLFKDASAAGWVLLNPWRTEEDVNNDIRLSPYENGRNISIGYSTATAAKAKLDVNGKIFANDSLIGKTIKLDGAKVANMRRNGNDLHISSDGKIILDKEINASNGLSVTGGNITVASGNSFVGNGTVPVGGIILWSGSVTSLPTGWRLCDGSYGTPNLRGKFVVGYDNTKTDYNTVGKTGGLETVTLSNSQMPNHKHDVFTFKTNASNSGTGSIIRVIRNNGESNNCSNTDMKNCEAQSTATTVQGNGSAHENRPPYYVLAYIMRVN